MISDAEVEKALDYLRDKVDEAANARATRVYLEAWVKTVKAEMQTKQVGVSAAAADAIATCSPEYIAALDAMRDAIRSDERHRFLREAAMARLDAWRTQSSNERAARI